MNRIVEFFKSLDLNYSLLYFGSVFASGFGLGGSYDPFDWYAVLSWIGIGTLLFAMVRGLLNYLDNN